MYPNNLASFRYTIVNTLHKSDKYNNNNNNNNNNKIHIYRLTFLNLLTSMYAQS